jgi:hypothetical protein
MYLEAANQEQINTLKVWLSFSHRLATKVDTTSKESWTRFKETVGQEYEDICSECERDGYFDHQLYLDYYSRNIFGIAITIISGYEILMENVCEPDSFYLEYNSTFKNAFSLINKINSEAYQKYCDHTKGFTIHDFEIGDNGVFSLSNSNKKSSIYGVIEGEISSLTFRQYIEEEFLNELNSNTEFAAVWRINAI